MSGRDDIDFGTVKVSRLFRQIFFPTLMGMASWSLLTVADGMFVGWGVGSHGIAAINICYPIFLVLSGFALMMGMGALNHTGSRKVTTITLSTYSVTSLASKYRTNLY